MQKVTVVLSFTALLIAVFSLNVQCQEVKIFRGDAVSDVGTGKLTFFASDSSNLYCFRWLVTGSSRKYHVEIYDRDSLKLRCKTKIPFPDSDSVDFSLEGLIILPDYYQLFYSYFSKKTRRENLELIEFNRAGEKIQDTKMIDASDGKNSRKAGSFSVMKKADHTGYLTWLGKVNHDTVSITISTYDYSNAKVNEHTFILEKDFGDVAYKRLDTRGNLYFLISSDLNSKHGLWKIRIYCPDSVPVNILLKEPSAKEIIPSDRFFSFVSEPHILNFITPYRSGSSQKSTGFYWIQVDEVSHSLLREKAIPFNSLLADKMSDDFKVESCIITHILPERNKSYKIIFESRLAMEQTMYGAHMETDYTYGNIVSVTLDSAFNSKGMCIIYKKQLAKEENNKFLSYLVLRDSSTCFYLHNDIPENSVLKNQEDVETVRNNRLRKTVLVQTEVINDMIASRKKVEGMTYDENLEPLQIIRAFEVSDREVYTLQRKDNVAYLMKIYLK